MEPPPQLPRQTSPAIVLQRKGLCLLLGVSLLCCQPTGSQSGMTKVFFTRGCDPCAENKQNNKRQRGWRTAMPVIPACSALSWCQDKVRGHIEKAAARLRQQVEPAWGKWHGHAAVVPCSRAVQRNPPTPRPLSCSSRPLLDRGFPRKQPPQQIPGPIIIPSERQSEPKGRQRSNGFQEGLRLGEGSLP